MRGFVTTYLTTLLHIAVLTRRNEKTQSSRNKLTIPIETRQNIWELGDEFEGDVLQCCRRNIRKNESYWWPNSTLPFEFDSFYGIDKEQRQWLMDCLTEITKNSCVKIRLRTKADRDYVFITENRPGCSSYTGRIGGRQIMNLKRNVPGHGCFHKSVIVHEFMHALGFSHQHSVYNRDRYIKINYNNIRVGKERDFKMLSSDIVTSFGEEYDYKSIMHYSSYAKSKNGKRTIEAQNSTIVIERNMALSEVDIRKLNKLYPCNTKN